MYQSVAGFSAGAFMMNNRPIDVVLATGILGADTSVLDYF